MEGQYQFISFRRLGFAPPILPIARMHPDNSAAARWCAKQMRVKCHIALLIGSSYGDRGAPFSFCYSSLFL
jgi:hypothetical protein